MTALTLQGSRVVPHPPEQVWTLVADHPRYADVAPTLSAVEVVSGQGEGMLRRCTDTRGRSWTETCDRWEEGHRFSVEVDTSTYPLQLRLVLARFRGEWAVEPDRDGARIRLRFDGKVRGGPVAPLLAWGLRRRGQRLVESLLDGYERQLGG